MTYAELAVQRDRVAAALAARGVERGDVVALLVERTPTMLAALLGTLAAGATYVPLDPGFPASRLAFMLADADAKVVITDRGHRRSGSGNGANGPPRAACRVAASPASPRRDRRAQLARHAARSAAPSSTPARPPRRGDRRTRRRRVPHLHLGLDRQAQGRPRPAARGRQLPRQHGASARASSAGDRLVAVTTLSFDIAVLELLLPLVAGARDRAGDPRAGHRRRRARAACSSSTARRSCRPRRRPGAC